MINRAIVDPAAVSSFFHLPNAPEPGRACRGLACFAARSDNPQRWSQACDQSPEIYCLGQCHVGPALSGADVRPEIRSVGPTTILLETVMRGAVRNLDDYIASGGGKAWTIARETPPQSIIETISRSGLRGRGGAGFSAGKKWNAVRRSPGQPVVVVNADEGDPGAFSDKILLEDDPFRVLEGAAIAAHSVGARQIVVYLRCEYPMAFSVLREAIVQVTDSGWLGEISIELVTGRGSFLCGEESALLNALEGRRPFARARPPYPFERGLFGRPTLVHNVETLCSAVWIVRNGDAAYRAVGTNESSGTKLISLNSMFCRPGLVEIPFGMTLRQIAEDLGGGLQRGRWMGLMIGGPLAGLLPPSVFETVFAYETLGAVGGAVGHGGMIAFADDTDLRALIAEVFRFGASESCGLCVPCHRGTAEIDERFARSVEGRAAMRPDRWSALISALEQTSACGHGRGLAEFARSLERHYTQELQRCMQ